MWHLTNTRLRDSWRSVLARKDWSKGGIEYFNLLHVTCHRVPFPLQQLALIFHHLPFAAAVSVKAPLVDLHIPQQIQVQTGFGFPNLIPSGSDTVSTFFLGHLSLLASPVCFLFMFQFNQELLAHPCRPPATFIWLSAPGAGPFLSLEKVILENQPVLLDSSSLSAYWIF